MANRTFIRFLLCAAILATFVPGPAQAHEGLKIGLHECWLYQISQYSYFDLKIKSGGNYVWMRSDGTAKQPGKFERNGRRLNFTSGVLKRQNFKGRHTTTDLYGHGHVIYLYKGGWDTDDLKYDCSD